MAGLMAEPAPIRAAGWKRLLLVHLAQIPSVALIIASPSPWSWVAAGLWGSLVACAGTDSRWRWRNRLLVAEAVAWLVVGLLFIGG